eukprot:5499766-Amphidinium_carterae.2
MQVEIHSESSAARSSLCSACGVGQTEARAHTPSVDPGAGRDGKDRCPEGPVGGALGEAASGFHWFRVQGGCLHDGIALALT